MDRKCNLNMDVWVRDESAIPADIANVVAMFVSDLPGISEVTDEEWRWDVPNEMGTLIYATGVENHNKEGRNMAFELNMETENQAFYDNGADEVASILEQVAASLRSGKESGMLYDSYGNMAGDWSYEPPIREFRIMVEFTVKARDEDFAEQLVSGELGGISDEHIEDIQIQSVDEG